MNFSKRVLRLTDSPTLAIEAKAKEMIAQGIDVISFSAGQPDFSTPPHVKKAGIEAIEKNITGYTPTAGLPDLKKAVAEWTSRECGVKYEPNQVLVSAGAKFAIALAILTAIDEGDEVIFPAPYWVSYPDMVSLAGGIPVPLMTTMENNFKLTPETLEKAIGPRTRMILLNSPSNPTGAVYSKEELIALSDVIKINDNIWVLSDEIYSRLIFDGRKHISIASISDAMAERTIVANGVSKTFSMTGWRIGWLAGPREFIAKASMIQSHTISCPTSISQYASKIALMEPDNFLNNWVGTYQKRRDLAISLLEKIPGIKPFVPQGAFYIFCDIRKNIGRVAQDCAKIESCFSFAEYLLNEARVAVVPGGAFGMGGFIRLSFATDEASIEKGIARIAEAVKKLK